MSDAIANPRRGRKPAIESEDVAVNPARAAILPTEAGEAVKYEETIIEPVHDMVANEKMAMLAFLEEPVEIVIHESTDQNAIPVIPLSINGIMQPVARGVTTKVKRKYVAQLASLKETTYKQEIRQDALGNVVQKMVPHTARRFPFSVINDPNPRGASWLREMLAR